MSNMFLSSKTEKKHVEALVKCRYPELKNLRELFENTRSDALAQLLKAEEPARIYRLQERVYVLDEFLKAVEQSASVWERLK